MDISKAIKNIPDIIYDFHFSRNPDLYFFSRIIVDLKYSRCGMICIMTTTPNYLHVSIYSNILQIYDISNVNFNII